MSKTAIIIFNLGGPDKLENVKPFLYNLFNDPMILRLPAPFRQMLAWFISTRREKTAQEIYKEIDGKSPILENTQLQADKLSQMMGDGYQVYIGMRYWHPMFEQVMQKIKQDQPEKIILLPLYPQFSTTTTGSVFRIWDQLVKKIKLDIPTIKLCCYPIEQNFIQAVAVKTLKKLEEVKNKDQVRILFSAHGLPKKIVDQGDSYCWQVNQSAEKIIEILRKKSDIPFEPLVSYQSKVGPLEWTKPYTEEEIVRAGKEKKSLIIVPIAFVSEHSETLVELDIEYKEVADEAGVEEYLRVDTVGDDEAYIQGLKELILSVEKKSANLYSLSYDRICPDQFGDCPHKKAA